MVASLSSSDLSSYTKLQEELSATLTSSITMKSTNGKSGNIYIVITKNSAVCVLVSDTKPTDATKLPEDSDAVECARVSDAHFIVK